MTYNLTSDVGQLKSQQVGFLWTEYLPMFLSDSILRMYKVMFSVFYIDIRLWHFDELLFCAHHLQHVTKSYIKVNKLFKKPRDYKPAFQHLRCNWNSLAPGRLYPKCGRDFLSPLTFALQHSVWDWQCVLRISIKSETA